MLMALRDGSRVLAKDCEKGCAYHCPECAGEVVLHKGRKKIAHFAHKPPVSCSFAAGETRAHLESKQAFYDHFKSSGLAVEVEYPLSFNGVRSRADVYVPTTRRGVPAAIEIQHTNISLDDIERRTRNYAQLGIAVAWVPLIDMDKLDIEIGGDGGWLVKKYSPKPFEKWVHGFNYGELWYYEHKEGFLWRGKLEPCVIEVPYSEWYEQGGEQRTAGGYDRVAKRWKTLKLTGMYPLREVQFSISPRQAKSLGGLNFPSCHMVKIAEKPKS